MRSSSSSSSGSSRSSSGRSRSLGTLRHLILLLGLFGAIIGVCQCVKITNLKVPSTFELDNSSDPDELILDCEYELGPKETGFVLKWLYNEQSIYQWIPKHKPYALSFMKGRIDTTYAASEDKAYAHRAILISKPMWNMTGDYTCHVQTFESSDKQSAHMQVIVPETDFQLNHNVDDEGMVNIRCSASDVFPEPKLLIVLGSNGDSGETTEQTTFATLPATRDETGLYDATAERRLSKDDLKSPTNINCILSLPGTNYTKKRETIFYDDKSIDTTSELSEHTYRSDANSRLVIDPNDDGTSNADRNGLSTMAAVASLGWLLMLVNTFA